jgi:hypothetical protein
MAIQDGVLDWLLREDNPPVRYLTLTNLLKKPVKDPEVLLAKSRLMDYDVTQGILQHGEEFWNRDERAYWKYTGKYWQLIFLGQFLANGEDSRIAEGAKDILTGRKWVFAKGAQCLTANILAALTQLGYGDHPIVKEEREALARRTVADGGVQCGVMDYSLLTRCYMAQPKLLLCFAQVPPRKRSKAVSAAIELLVSSLLEHEVYVYVPGNRKEWQVILERQPKRADLPKGQTVKASISDQKERLLVEKGLGTRKPKAGWFKFGFPLHYNSDILEAMYALAVADTPKSSNLRRPLQVIKEKMTPEGKWIMENSLNGKTRVDVEEKGKPSKWLTYFALSVLDHFDSGQLAA